jgi:hypothetical protein
VVKFAIAIWVAKTPRKRVETAFVAVKVEKTCKLGCIDPVGIADYHGMALPKRLYDQLRVYREL